ncbi:ATP/GTP-binding protein [Rhizobiaceae bacterium]|nr:ATP/GTP-binding protein [Rhizobiaceae bacterium]
MHLTPAEQKVLDRIAASDAPRLLVAIAGPPGSGKSTFAERLRDILAGQGESVVVVPMDGYHLDNETLESQGLLPRKGAPETFDAEAFATMVEMLRDATDTISVPGFDRAADAVVRDQTTVPQQARVVLIEGNYVLLRTQPWARMANLFDFKVLLAPSFSVLEERLVSRWLEHGLSPAAARARALENDIPNAHTVLEQSTTADLVLGE